VVASEAAEQVAAPAESSNTQLAPGTHTRMTECGWKGGDRDSAANSLGGGSGPFLDRLYFVRVSAAAVKALRFAPTAHAARRARPGLRPLTPNISNHPVKEKKYLIKDLTGDGLFMEGRRGGERRTRTRSQRGRRPLPRNGDRPYAGV
jgi:hypothetical protein